MINYKQYFEGKRITKQGFGVLGRGYGVVRFLLESGAKVLVTDTKPLETFTAQVAELENFCTEKGIDKNNLTYRLGEHALEDFENCDYVIAASGVPKDNIYLNHAKGKGIKVYQESSLFVEIVRDFNNSILEKSLEKNILQNPETIKIVGITGTRAKTTTTFLIKAILDEFVKEGPSGSSVYFGGNVQGVATLENLKSLNSGDYVVMELDSWVLQGFGDIKFSPQVAVFTTFMPDHMNYYKGDMAEYFKDKANIFLYQKEGNVLVTTEAVERKIQKYLSYVKIDSERVLVSEVEMEEGKNIFKSKLLGRHNQIPVSLAVRVGRVLCVSEEIIRKVVGGFRGVKGRLELIKEFTGVRVYNDTTATTGDAAVAAMRAVEELLVSEGGAGKMILITGGRDKELDMTRYLDTMEDLYNKGIFKKIIFLQDETTTGTNRVLKEKVEAAAKYSFTYDVASSLEQAVQQAKSLAAQGDVLILSPGFASFGMFQNEYDRGDKFVVAIDKYFK